MKRKYCTFLAAILCVALFIPSPARAQFSISVSPGVLYVDGTELALTIYAENLAEGVVALWNGAERPIEVSSSDIYRVTLQPGDVATPGLAQLELYSPWSRRTVASLTVPVYYNVKVRDIVYDPVRKRFYLTTAQDVVDVRFPPNALMAMDSETGVIGPVMTEGGGPGNLSLSADGSALYVTMDESGLVRRVSPDSLETVSEYRVRADSPEVPDTDYRRMRVAVSPLGPATVAVSWHPNPQVSTTQLAIFDNGVQRPSASAMGAGDRLMFTPDGQALFTGSYARWDWGTSCGRIAINADGIPKQTPEWLPGGAPVAFLGDLLYTAAGTILDTRTFDVVGLLGVGMDVAPDPDRARILTTYPLEEYNGSAPSFFLQAFDMNTLEPLGRLKVAPPSPYVSVSAVPTRAIRFGDDGVMLVNLYGLMPLHTPLAGPAPEIGPDSVQNAVGLTLAAVVPGQLVLIRGHHLGPRAPRDYEPNARGRTDPSLAGVQVWFGRTQGTVVLASEDLVEVVVPKSLKSGSTVALQLWHQGIPSARVTLDVVDPPGADSSEGGAQ